MFVWFITNQANHTQFGSDPFQTPKSGIILSRALGANPEGLPSRRSHKYPTFTRASAAQVVDKKHSWHEVLRTPLLYAAEVLSRPNVEPFLSKS